MSSVQRRWCPFAGCFVLLVVMALEELGLHWLNFLVVHRLGDVVFVDPTPDLVAKYDLGAFVGQAQPCSMSASWMLGGAYIVRADSLPLGSIVVDAGPAARGLGVDVGDWVWHPRPANVRELKQTLAERWVKRCEVPRVQIVDRSSVQCGAGEFTFRLIDYRPEPQRLSAPFVPSSIDDATLVGATFAFEAIVFVAMFVASGSRSWRFRVWLLALVGSVMATELRALSMIGFTDYAVF